MKPRSVTRQWCSSLPPFERRELEEILAAHKQGAAAGAALRDRFHSDYGDSSVWWMLLIAAGGAGLGACISLSSVSVLWSFLWFPQYLSEYGLMTALQGLKYGAGAWASLLVLAWAAFAWTTNHRRRGHAITSFATIRVKGYRLALLRHADVAGIEWTQHATRTQRFSVLRLTAGDGRRLTLYGHAGWVRAAIAEIDRARAAAGLPAIAGDARKLPG
ncbi:MAG TPA: hypothetical protein VE981_00885 [Planctomycetota bacterium]|nr:hypothetical protein [Planctomycetota bacterium]